MMVKCRHFNGYKPCVFSEGSSANCVASCANYSEIHSSILIVHLGALGAVLRATAILPAIKRKYPKSMITWITDAPAHNLLKNNPYLDRIMTTSSEDILSLSALKFDVAFVVDKSLKAAGILAHTKADFIYGFVADERTGAILPASFEAEELWQVGLDDSLKFFKNKKSELQLMVEALALGEYRRDRYVVKFSDDEEKIIQQKKRQWSDNGMKTVVGINTGCAGVIPYKKLSVEKQRELVRLLSSKYVVVLLGGPEDSERNQQIATGLEVIQSATNLGLRDGLTSVAACDVVLTGDSLGMHMSIAVAQYTVAWFGPTCAHEIDFFDRGEAVLADVSCGPCWKRSCANSVMCYDQVSTEKLLKAIERGVNFVLNERSSLYPNSISRRPSSEHSDASSS